MAEVNNSASLFWRRIVSTVDRLNNTTRRHECVRLVDHQHNASCTLPNWQWHCDCKIIKRQQRHCTSYNAIHLTVSRIIHAIRFQSRGHSLRTPKELRALNRLLSEWVTVTLSGSASSQWLFNIVRVRLCGHSLRTPKELRVLDGCWANGWRWRLAEAQAANDSVRYSFRLALLWLLTPIIVRILCAWRRLLVEF